MNDLRYQGFYPIRLNRHLVPIFINGVHDVKHVEYAANRYEETVFNHVPPRTDSVEALVVDN
jgi:hypothetical protein